MWGEKRRSSATSQQKKDQQNGKGNSQEPQQYPANFPLRAFAMMSNIHSAFRFPTVLPGRGRREDAVALLLAFLVLTFIEEARCRLATGVALPVDPRPLFAFGDGVLEARTFFADFEERGRVPAAPSVAAPTAVPMIPPTKAPTGPPTAAPSNAPVAPPATFLRM